MSGFFALDAAHRAAGRLILSAIKPAPPKVNKPGEKPPPKARVTPWVTSLYANEGETARMIHVLADSDPARVQQIRRTCNFLDIARAYAFKMAETEGMGYYFPE